MARPKSGYKRQASYQAPSGVWIEIRTEEAYQKLKTCAAANHCTIGQLAESWVRYALTGEPYIPAYRHTGQSTPTKRKRGFRLSEMTFAWAEAKHGDNAEGWIKLTLLSQADIEMTRIRGEQREQEWTERYRI